jgi:hypothetical protein
MLLWPLILRTLQILYCCRHGRCSVHLWPNLTDYNKLRGHTKSHDHVPACVNFLPFLHPYAATQEHQLWETCGESRFQEGYHRHRLECLALSVVCGTTQPGSMCSRYHLWTSLCARSAVAPPQGAHMAKQPFVRFCLGGGCRHSPGMRLVFNLARCLFFSVIQRTNEVFALFYTLF